jgi:Ca2+-binding EF-hand superfamily protein
VAAIWSTTDCLQAVEDYEAMGTTMRRVIKQVEELRRRKKYLQVRLEQIFLKAFKLCDVNNDGDVSMEECIVLDKQVRWDHQNKPLLSSFSAYGKRPLPKTCSGQT